MTSEVHSQTPIYLSLCLNETKIPRYLHFPSLCLACLITKVIKYYQLSC